MTRVTARATASWLVRLVTTAGLGVDAGIHLDLASIQPPAQVNLFYAEGAAAILAALLVLATASRLAYVFAFLVAVTALGAVLLYRYVDVGPLGPLPNMYEPFWYPTKVSTTIAEAVAVLTAATGALRPGWSAHGHPSAQPGPLATHSDAPRPAGPSPSGGTAESADLRKNGTRNSP
jgi:hypothetical protein